ncbi:MAG: tetratricopeptide repeat protein, partial [Candidatus Symbiothrix sp.]|nr:tetratricopeptide repeat protein [Candidatus Symbiothrix sp.]
MDSNNHNTHLPQVPFRGFRGILLILTLIIGISSPAFSQKQVRKDIREGNKEYRQGKFTDAEVDYRKALET